ncbi:MAG: hypothetical protein IJY20_06975 [Clostridia bacterium]|nr:hypothetical protein [Clostridia bacterium]
MPVGKNSINRISKATTKATEGIRSLAPEVPAGDAAKPVSAKKSTVKAAPKTTKTQTTKPVSQATVAHATKSPTIAIGQDLPYWLL